MRIYLFPFLLDFVAFVVQMWVTDAAGRALHFSDSQMAAIMVLFTIAYFGGSLVIGRWLTQHNARAAVVASSLGSLAVCIAVFASRTFLPILLFMIVFGAVLAVFFNSFQTFMRGQAPPGSLAQVVSRYTLAWSMGIGLGFLLSGLFVALSSVVALGILTSVACLAVTALVFTTPPAAVTAARPSADGHVEPVPAGVEPGRFVMIGWCLVLVANIALGPLRTFIPKTYAEAQYPAWIAGGIFCLLHATQALTGFGIQFRPALYYRRWPLVLAQVVLLGAFGLLWLRPSPLGCAAVAVVLGTCTGFLFCASVYYVSNDANSSRNVGINEAMVAVGGIAGISVAERALAWWPQPAAYVPAIGLLLLGLLLFQLWWLRPRVAVAIAVPDRVA